MKSYIIILLCLVNSISAFTQSSEKLVKDSLKESSDSSYTNVAIVTDIDFASSTNASDSDNGSAIGTLGLKFERPSIFGGVNFTVFSQNESISATDSIQTDIFGKNLLLPQSSTQSLNSFSGFIGVKNLNFLKVYNHWAIWDLAQKRFGFYSNFQLNNTVWTKDSMSLPITLSSFNFNITLTLLDEKILKNEEKIKIILLGGFSNRSLGGDYGLEINRPLRKQFIGTDDLGFNGTNFGIRLELSKFYGELQVSNFSYSQSIAGFSGNQAIVRVGLLADINLPTENLSKNLSELRKGKMDKEAIKTKKRKEKTERKADRKKRKTERNPVRMARKDQKAKEKAEKIQKKLEEINKD